MKLATIQGLQRVLYDPADPGELNIQTCRSLRDRAGIVLADVDNRAPKSPVRSRFSCGIRIYARSNARTPRTGHLRRTFPLNSSHRLKHFRCYGLTSSGGSGSVAAISAVRSARFESRSISSISCSVGPFRRKDADQKTAARSMINLMQVSVV